jgi:hypothetical protein
MPQGYYTVEQWKRPKKGAELQWTEVLQLPFGTSLTEAENALKRLDKPGLYRLLQMQRVIWAEQDGNSLRMRKSHASSPQSLDHIREMFDRSRGRDPIEEVQAARRRAKKLKAK